MYYAIYIVEQNFEHNNKSVIGYVQNLNVTPMGDFFALCMSCFPKVLFRKRNSLEIDLTFRNCHDLLSLRITLAI